MNVASDVKAGSMTYCRQPVLQSPHLIETELPSQSEVFLPKQVVDEGSVVRDPKQV